MIRCSSVDAVMAHHAVHDGGLRRLDIERAIRDARLIVRGLLTLEEVQAESERRGALVRRMLPPWVVTSGYPAPGALP